MEKAVRVLQVLDFINHNSGVSAVVMNYYMHLSPEQVKCDFLLYEPAVSDLEQVIVAQGSKIYTTGQPNGKQMLSYHKRVKHFFSEHAGEYDIVHIHIPNAAFIILNCAKKYGVPVRIIHSHNARGADGIGKKIRNFVLNKWGICYANRCMACSVAAGKYLFGKKKMEKGQVIILNNAVNLKKYRYNIQARENIRKQLGIKNELLLGHIGRFSEQKNHRCLLDILVELQNRAVNCRLVLLGDGPLQAEVKRSAREKGLLDKVIFAGIVDNVEEYLSAMDVFLLPSLYEGLPVVCVEAQAAGLPCLISASVTREIALTEEVMFLENSDISAWCNEIENLSKKIPDRNQHLKVDDYDIQKQAGRLERMYLSYGMGADINVHI